jgi:alpha-tubulin suppressor-like RCC1 family protein
LNKPELNQTLNDLNINISKCGAMHSLALTRNGDVYQWGWDGVERLGRLEIRKRDFDYSPIKVNNFENEVVMSIQWPSQKRAMSTVGEIMSMVN